MLEVGIFSASYSKSVQQSHHINLQNSKNVKANLFSASPEVTCVAIWKLNSGSCDARKQTARERMWEDGEYHVPKIVQFVGFSK